MQRAIRTPTQGCTRRRCVGSKQAFQRQGVLHGVTADIVVEMDELLVALEPTILDALGPGLLYNCGNSCTLSPATGKCRAFVVTRVRSCSKAVAAMSASGKEI